MPGAGIAAEHECCRFIRPALENVRAFRFLTNGVKIQTFNKIKNLVLVGRVTEFDLQPIGLFQLWPLFSVQESLYEDLLFDHKNYPG